jgi:hypothetical protein
MTQVGRHTSTANVACGFHTLPLRRPRDRARGTAQVLDVEEQAATRRSNKLQGTESPGGPHAGTKPDTHGFPRVCSGPSFATGFQTGDIVRAEVAKGKHAGTDVGLVAIRRNGGLRVGNADGINRKHRRIVQRADGYGYGRNAAPRPEGRGINGSF